MIQLNDEGYTTIVCSCGTVNNHKAWTCKGCGAILQQ